MQFGSVIPKNRQVVGHTRICQQHISLGADSEFKRHFNGTTEGWRRLIGGF